MRRWMARLGLVLSGALLQVASGCQWLTDIVDPVTALYGTRSDVN